MSPAGGARPGAGRPALAEKTVMKSVKLKAEQWAKAQRIGDGNAAAGIRKALDEYQDDKP